MAHPSSHLAPEISLHFPTLYPVPEYHLFQWQLNRSRRVPDQ